MRTAVRWVFSLTSSARPDTSSLQQASEATSSIETLKAGSSRLPPHARHGQESTVNPGTRLEASAAQLQAASCPVIGQLSQEGQATLPTVSKEGSSSVRQSSAEDLPSAAEDLQLVGKQTGVEATPKGTNPVQVGS